MYLAMVVNCLKKQQQQKKHLYITISIYVQQYLLLHKVIKFKS